MDPFNEARAIALIHFPCPPMPVMGNATGEQGYAAVLNSHDMLSAFMISAFKRQDPESNRRRREIQTELDAKFRNALPHIMQPDFPFEIMYATMASFTREYLQSYHERPMDIRVLPPSEITPLMLEHINGYFTAQRILNGEDVDLNKIAVDYRLDCSVHSVLKGCLDRVLKRQQGVVSEPIFKGVDEDVGEEGDDPAALERRVEVLLEGVPLAVEERDQDQREEQKGGDVEDDSENV